MAQDEPQRGIEHVVDIPESSNTTTTTGRQRWSFSRLLCCTSDPARVPPVPARGRRRPQLSRLLRSNVSRASSEPPQLPATSSLPLDTQLPADDYQEGLLAPSSDDDDEGATTTTGPQVDILPPPPQPSVPRVHPTEHTSTPPPPASQDPPIAPSPPPAFQDPPPPPPPAPPSTPSASQIPLVAPPSPQPSVPRVRPATQTSSTPQPASQDPPIAPPPPPPSTPSASQIPLVAPPSPQPSVPRVRPATQTSSTPPPASQDPPIAPPPPPPSTPSASQVRPATQTSSTPPPASQDLPIAPPSTPSASQVHPATQTSSPPPPESLDPPPALPGWLSLFLQLWHFVVLVGVLHSCIIVPLTLAFRSFKHFSHHYEMTEPYVDALIMFDVFITGIAPTFSTKPEARRARYILAGVDSLREIVYFVVHYYFNSQPLLCLFLRVLRVMRLRKYKILYSSVEDYQQRKGWFFLVQFLRETMVLLLLIHVGACCFFYLTLNTAADQNWLGKGCTDDYKGAGVRFCYLRSTYLSSATVTSVGYGDYHPVLGKEMVCSCVFMILGCLRGFNFQPLLHAWFHHGIGF